MRIERSGEPNTGSGNAEAMHGRVGVTACDIASHRIHPRRSVCLSSGCSNSSPTGDTIMAIDAISKSPIATRAQRSPSSDAADGSQTAKPFDPKELIKQCDAILADLQKLLDLSGSAGGLGSKAHDGPDTSQSDSGANQNSAGGDGGGGAQAGGSGGGCGGGQSAGPGNAPAGPPSDRGGSNVEKNGPTNLPGESGKVVDRAVSDFQSKYGKDMKAEEGGKKDIQIGNANGNAGVTEARHSSQPGQNDKIVLDSSLKGSELKHVAAHEYAHATMSKEYEAAFGQQHEKSAIEGGAEVLANGTAPVGNYKNEYYDKGYVDNAAKARQQVGEATFNKAFFGGDPASIAKVKEAFDSMGAA
jgi:hypothetical protein